ncbi:MAG: chemotaxis protein CheW [Pseudomonadota bacterium]
MARRIDLRAYQDSIAARLAAARDDAGAPALLGFEAGGTRWLVDLPAAGEVLPPPPLAPVPLTRPWFAGLANLHGELGAVVDFAAFCGGPSTPPGGAARLLRIGARHGSNVALLVARVHGLKRVDALVPTDPAPGPAAAWRGASLGDAQGERWVRLDVERLLADPEFIDAALPETAGIPT